MAPDMGPKRVGPVWYRFGGGAVLVSKIGAKLTLAYGPN